MRRLRPLRRRQVPQRNRGQVVAYRQSGARSRASDVGFEARLPRVQAKGSEVTERIVCVKCGQDGHRSGQCPWPAVNDITAAQQSKYHGSSESGMQNALLAVLAHPGGITAIAIAEMICLRIDSTLSKLRILRDRGEIGVSRQGGRNALWMTYTAVACANLEYAEKKRCEAAESQARRHAKKRSAAIAEKEYAECEFLAPVVHRIIPAMNAERLYPAGPRSVFEFAHC